MARPNRLRPVLQALVARLRSRPHRPPHELEPESRAPRAGPTADRGPRNPARKPSRVQGPPAGSLWREDERVFATAADTPRATERPEGSIWREDENLVDVSDRADAPKIWRRDEGVGAAGGRPTQLDLGQTTIWRRREAPPPPPPPPPLERRREAPHRPHRRRREEFPPQGTPTGRWPRPEARPPVLGQWDPPQRAGKHRANHVDAIVATSPPPGPASRDRNCGAGPGRRRGLRGLGPCLLASASFRGPRGGTLRACRGRHGGLQAPLLGRARCCS